MCTGENMCRESGGYLLLEEFLFLQLVIELVYTDHLLAALLRSRRAIGGGESQAAFANWKQFGGIAFGCRVCGEEGGWGQA
jgi:hypothetical protein